MTVTAGEPALLSGPADSTILFGVTTSVNPFFNRGEFNVLSGAQAFTGSGGVLQTVSMSDPLGPETSWSDGQSLLYEFTGTFDPNLLSRSNDPQILGIRLSVEGEDYYGWVSITDINDIGTQYTLSAYAYNTVPGEGIFAGTQDAPGPPPAASIPEPGTMAMMALAMSGLGLLRRRLYSTPQPLPQMPTDLPKLPCFSSVSTDIYSR